MRHIFGRRFFLPVAAAPDSDYQNGREQKHKQLFRSGFKTSDQLRDQGAGFRKNAAYQAYVSILRKTATQISELRWVLKWLLIFISDLLSSVYVNSIPKLTGHRISLSITGRQKNCNEFILMI
jgi:hypothetical protein